MLQILDEPGGIREQSGGRIDLAVGGDIVALAVGGLRFDIFAVKLCAGGRNRCAEGGQTGRDINVGFLCGVFGQRKAREAVFCDHTDLYLIFN